MIARWTAALAGSACMATKTTTSSWTAHQRSSPTAQGPASLVGGEYMAASAQGLYEISDYITSGTTRRSLQWRSGKFFEANAPISQQSHQRPIETPSLKSKADVSLQIARIRDRRLWCQFGVGQQ